MISAAESMSKKNRRKFLRVILFRLSENSILMDEISKDIFNRRARQDITSGKFSSEKIISNEYKTEIQSLERKNLELHYASRNETLDLKDFNSWKIFTGHIKHSVMQVMES